MREYEVRSRPSAAIGSGSWVQSRRHHQSAGSTPGVVARVVAAARRSAAGRSRSARIRRSTPAASSGPSGVGSGGDGSSARSRPSSSRNREGSPRPSTRDQVNTIRSRARLAASTKRRRSASSTARAWATEDRKSTRLNSSHGSNAHAAFCLKKKNNLLEIRRQRRIEAHYLASERLIERQ